MVKEREQNGASNPPSPTTLPHHAAVRDAREAVLLAESAFAQAVDADCGAAVAQNVFGDRLRIEPPLDPVARVRRAASLACSGERIGVVTSAADLSAARGAMRELAGRRLGVVLHAIEATGPDAALALGDLGWALLFASNVEESLDLTLVARRAAEDSGTPFLVVHDYPAAAHAEPLPPLDAAFVDALVGPASARMRRAGEPSHRADEQVGPRAFAERVPFALASALRELEALTGRKRDLITRSATGQGAEAPLMLVGLGVLGDLLLAEVPRLRAAGHDVGAVKLTAFRPFSGPRAVRLLARALAVTVLERTDEPLAQSNPVTRELKAAFSDALTWAPEYPGIGRVPRVHSGVSHLSPRDVESRHIDAVVRNMMAGEAGRRFFIMGGEPSLALDPASAGTTETAPQP